MQTTPRCSREATTSWRYVKTQLRPWFVPPKTEVEREEAVKLLEFWVNQKLHWNSHIEKICDKQSGVVFLVIKLKLAITQPCLLCVYDALFRSHLIDGLVVGFYLHAVREVFPLKKTCAS